MAIWVIIDLFSFTFAFLFCLWISWILKETMENMFDDLISVGWETRCNKIKKMVRLNIRNNL